MSDSYEERQKMEAKGQLLESEAVLVGAEAERLEARSRYARERAHWACVVGPAIVVHAIWASALVAMTWIWVVRGWRGG